MFSISSPGGLAVPDLMAAAGPGLPWPADQVERWPVDRLIPYARNARTHSPEQVKQIAASMREWGWTIPVLADEAGGIIAGHGRIMAAELNGYNEAPVMIARGWSEAKKRAYVIADNKLALNAAWDVEMLGVELLDLRDMGANLELIGFDASELKPLLREVEEAAPPELATGDRLPFEQMTFTLHDSQAAAVREALTKAKAAGPFAEPAVNENSNGNALARIVEHYLGR
jgi:ParB-like chromosome segregation protein Spo0J